MFPGASLFSKRGYLPLSGARSLALGLTLLALGWALMTGSRAEAQPTAPAGPRDSPLTAALPLFNRGIRGITIGPIESSLQANRGYGSPPFQSVLRLTQRLGGNWVSLTPFGRIWDLHPTGVDQSFEAPVAETARRVSEAVRQAHAQGLKVLLVPHLWAEAGGWRGEIDPKTEPGWQAWARGYRHFLLFWAKLAAQCEADMLAVGVELRSWVTTSHAPTFSALIKDVRRVYDGPLTYAANWDDAEDTVIWGELDVIGVNAFFPLAEKKGASLSELLSKSTELSERVQQLSESWHKPVLFTEIGYTTRPDPALRPWEWPDGMKNVVVDQRAQADAYRALIAPFLDEPWFMGFFVWRWYADPHDMSQEAEWGFSPFGKQAELVLRDAFTTHWAADGPRPLGASLLGQRAKRVGLY